MVGKNAGRRTDVSRWRSVMRKVQNYLDKQKAAEKITKKYSNSKSKER